jgi:hypothetical protein
MYRYDIDGNVYLLAFKHPWEARVKRSKRTHLKYVAHHHIGTTCTIHLVPPELLTDEGRLVKGTRQEDLPVLSVGEVHLYHLDSFNRSEGRKNALKKALLELKPAKEHLEGLDGDNIKFVWNQILHVRREIQDRYDFDELMESL